MTRHDMFRPAVWGLLWGLSLCCVGCDGVATCNTADCGGVASCDMVDVAPDAAPDVPGVVCVEGEACDDGNACTVRDECFEGSCVGSVPGCDDGNMCTRNVCHTEAGCLAIPLTNGLCDAGVPR